MENVHFFKVFREITPHKSKKIAIYAILLEDKNKPEPFTSLLTSVLWIIQANNWTVETVIKPVFFTISEQIADNIRKSIIFGELEEGTPLREMELSKQYSVSRGPVRDALKELAKEGFLDMVPNVGVRVAKHPSDETYALVMQLRRDLEDYVIENVYDKFTDEHFEDLASILETFKKACETNNMYEVVNMDIEFHRYIVCMMDDLHIRDLWQSVMNRMLFRYGRFDSLLESYEEHYGIYEAIKSKDKALILERLNHNFQ